MLVAINMLWLPLLWTSSSQRELGEPLFSHRSCVSNCEELLQQTPQTHQQEEKLLLHRRANHIHPLKQPDRWVISVKYDFYTQLCTFIMKKKARQDEVDI